MVENEKQISFEKKHALRVSPAVTRLTVYRGLQVREQWLASFPDLIY